MSNIVIDVSDLHSYEGESVKDLASFLKKRLDGTVTVAKKEVTLEFEEGKEVSRVCLRLLLRKFLHQADLKEELRVISGGENSFTIKERKVFSE